MLERRRLLTGGACLAVLPAAAQQAQGDKALMDRIIAAAVLPDKVFGATDAPVTIVEYASVTCHFCMKFHTETWPALKAKYVDAGKVRFIMREFPLDPLASAAFMLARCAGDDKWYPMLDLLYRTKENWGHSQNPSETLLQTVRQGGFTKDSFEACLRDEQLFQNVKRSAEVAARDFGVNSTPTFFINGERRTGALTLQEFDRILEPMLAARR